MRTSTALSIKPLWIGLLVIITAFALVGCAGFVRHVDPLAGFHVSSLGNLDSNKAITDDYKTYIEELSPKEKRYLGPIFFYENGAGQHAVRIETDINGTDCWYHILFYDKENKRTKVIKYYNGRYMS